MVVNLDVYIDLVHVLQEFLVLLVNIPQIVRRFLGNIVKVFGIHHTDRVINGRVVQSIGYPGVKLSVNKDFSALLLSSLGGVLGFSFYVIGGDLLGGETQTGVRVGYAHLFFKQSKRPSIFN